MSKNASGNTVFTVDELDTNDNAVDLTSGDKYLAISNGFYDAAGNQGAAANVTFTVDATPPTVSKAEVNAKSLTLTFSENLKSDSVSDKVGIHGHFVNFRRKSNSHRRVAEQRVTHVDALRADQRPRYGRIENRLNLAYTVPDDNKLQDALGNEVLAITDSNRRD